MMKKGKGDRYIELKSLDEKLRNKIRSILATVDEDTIPRLNKIRNQLTKNQISTFDKILSSDVLVKAARHPLPFPSAPPFKDALFVATPGNLHAILTNINNTSKTFLSKIQDQIDSLEKIDELTFAKNQINCIEEIEDHINRFGWSHTILRRLVLVHELCTEENSKVEKLVQSAGLNANNAVVTSIIHAYAAEQNYLTTKRSALNIPFRGTINKYSNAIVRITFKPYADDIDDLTGFLSEIIKCSVIDGLILANLNSHLYDINLYPEIKIICDRLGKNGQILKLSELYPIDDAESEYIFYKHSSAWLEYPMIQNYRMLVDFFYDPSDSIIISLDSTLKKKIEGWVGVPSIQTLVQGKITNHSYPMLSQLEQAGRVSRSAILNYWFLLTEGQVRIEKDNLLYLMNITRDLSKTAPIEAVRTAAQLSTDEIVKFILLLILAKRSKNERDNNLLRRLLQKIVLNDNGGSIVRLVESFQEQYPAIAEYIYDITTEDMLAKLTSLAPHLSDIPEIRASLHEWMARFSNSPHYLERARKVRIDHQLNRVRNEIDDHRIYVDPSRFSSWINDEVMVELNMALTTVGIVKNNSVSGGDEALISSIVKRCYSAFCSNSIFGIASYIGRRIRHGTFRGHLYTGTVKHIEGYQKFSQLFKEPNFLSRWNRWKEKYNHSVCQIINDNLHVESRSKPKGLLQPENYATKFKSEVLAAAVKVITEVYSKVKSTEALDQTITECCWQLAEIDLREVIKQLKFKHHSLKNIDCLDECIASISNKSLAQEFKREVIQIIDKKLNAMYGWFKRPSNISPTASLSLLFSAVVEEVKDMISTVNVQSQPTEEKEIELIGGAYHFLYDAMYVVVCNAAKYGDPWIPIRRSFYFLEEKKCKKIIVEIISAIRPEDRADDVSRIIEERKLINHDDANLYDRRSGIPKLMQLAHSKPEFEIEFFGVIENEVHARFSYVLN